MSGKKARPPARTRAAVTVAGVGGVPSVARGVRLVEWFSRHQRDFPWRGPFPRDPYRVLVAETLLQQTQAARVAPVFTRFLERFPDLRSLAAAPVEAVLAAFSGLGYYRRARLLHRAAQAIVLRGSWPRDAAGLRALPGLGAYTAAALGAFAFDGTEPPVDGNVARVAARRGALVLPLGSANLARAGCTLGRALHREAPGPTVFEALMELGATLCSPDAPRCAACPLADGCAGRATGAPERFPLPRPTRVAEHHVWVALWLRRADGCVLMRRVTDGPLLRGLWLPPFAPVAAAETPAAAAMALARSHGHAGALEAQIPVRHGITHRRITVHPFVAASEATRARDCNTPPGRGDAPGPYDDQLGWYDPQAPGVATSALLGKLLRACTDARPADARCASRADARRAGRADARCASRADARCVTRKVERHARHA
jgi:A/G-specific adenine glycosylase